MDMKIPHQTGSTGKYVLSGHELSSRTHLMGILHIHLMIYLLECTTLLPYNNKFLPFSKKILKKDVKNEPGFLNCVFHIKYIP